LGEIATIQGGGTPSSAIHEYWNGEINWFTPTEVFNQGYLFESRRKITPLGLNKSSAKLLPKGAVLFTSRAGVGDMGILTRPSATNQGFQSIIPNKEIPAYFIFTLQPLISKMANRLASGSTFTEISGNSVTNIQIIVPAEASEKIDIAKLFQKIDNLIAANEEKVSELKILKKLLMQRIFNQRWRFKGFTDPWEQRKLYEMVNHVTRKNTKLQSTLPLTISARYGLVDQNDFFNKQVASRDVSGYYLIENGEFAYNKSYSKGYPVGTIKRLDRYSEGVLSTLYILFKPVHISSQFLVAYFEGNMWHQEVARRATEGARNHGLLNIAPKDFFEMRLVVPSHREQDMIGKSLQSLDNLIAANECIHVMARNVIHQFIDSKRLKKLL